MVDDMVKYMVDELYVPGLGILPVLTMRRIMYLLSRQGIPKGVDQPYWDPRIACRPTGCVCDQYDAVPKRKFLETL